VLLAPVVVVEAPTLEGLPVPVVPVVVGRGMLAVPGVRGARTQVAVVAVVVLVQTVALVVQASLS